MTAPFSRADAVAEAVRKEVERMRPALDHAVALSSVTIIVNLHERTGLPRRVVVRTEAGSEADGRDERKGGR